MPIESAFLSISAKTAWFKGLASIGLSAGDDVIGVGIGPADGGVGTWRKLSGSSCIIKYIYRSISFYYKRFGSPCQ